MVLVLNGWAFWSPTITRLVDNCYAFRQIKQFLLFQVFLCAKLLKAKQILFFVIQDSSVLASFRIFLTYHHGNFLVFNGLRVLYISVHTRSRNLLRSSLEASFNLLVIPESAIVYKSGDSFF